MGCETANELAAVWYEAISEYGRAVAELRDKLRTSDPAIYSVAQITAERVRLTVEKARLALEEHRVAHRCLHF